MLHQYWHEPPFWSYHPFSHMKSQWEIAVARVGETHLFSDFLKYIEFIGNEVLKKKNNLCLSHTQNNPENS